MGNWTSVAIIGHIDAAEAQAARAFIIVGNDWARFHCLCYTGPSLAGLGIWVPTTGGQISAFGNLSERDYGPEAVADTLTALAAVAPSLALKVHCGGDYESQTCVATVVLADGEATVRPPEIDLVGEGIAERGMQRLVAFLDENRRSS